MDKEIKQSINRFLFSIITMLLGIILSGLLLKQMWFWFVASQFGLHEFLGELGLEHADED